MVLRAITNNSPKTVQRSQSSASFTSTHNLCQCKARLVDSLMIRPLLFLGAVLSIAASDLHSFSTPSRRSSMKIVGSSVAFVASVPSPFRRPLSCRLSATAVELDPQTALRKRDMVKHFAINLWRRLGLYENQSQAERYSEERDRANSEVMPVDTDLMIESLQKRIQRAVFLFETKPAPVTSSSCGTTMEALHELLNPRANQERDDAARIQDVISLWKVERAWLAEEEDMLQRTTAV
jgi:hypothetical protein